MKKFFKETYKFIFQIGLSLLDIFPDSNFGNRVRGLYLSFFVKGTKKRLQVCKRVHVLYPQKIIVGDDIYIGFGTWLNAMGGLELGNEIMTGPHVKISTGDHIMLNGSFRFGEHQISPVIVKNGSWLAANVVVTKGCVIGVRTVVAAGSVVTKNLESESLYGGVPAKKIK